MTSVKVHAYDLTGGLARQMSMQIIGKQMDAVYHTGIVAFGKEWWFGGGLSSAPPGTTHFGAPLEVIDMGTTNVPEQAFMDWLKSVEPTRFSPQHYNLLSHNCNTFTDEAARFLVGKAIPTKITGMLKEVMESPMGPMLLPMLEGMSLQQQQAMGGHAPTMNGMNGVNGSPPPPLGVLAPSAGAAAPAAISSNPWAGMGASSGPVPAVDDPDPELTMALMASMEEEQARQQSASGTTAPPATAAASSSEDAPVESNTEATVAASATMTTEGGSVGAAVTGGGGEGKVAKEDEATHEAASPPLCETERGRAEQVLGSALQVLKTNDEATINDLRKRLRTIALKLLQYPEEEKYRRFRLSNGTVQRRLVAPAGSLDWLRGLGFEEKEEGGEPVLMLAAGATDTALLRASTALLSEGL